MSSYSKLVKERLFKIGDTGVYESIAELLGIVLFACGVSFDEIKLSCECTFTALRFQKLLLGVFGIKTDVLRDNVYYTARIDDKKAIREIITVLKLVDEDNERVIKMRAVKALLEGDSCKSAFLRGAFLGGGTMVDPKKNYSIEFITHYFGLSDEFCEILDDMGLSCSITTRNSRRIIYSKNSDRIADILIAMGDAVSAEEINVIKEEKGIRNELNRTVNSETANIDKIINASIKQIRAIEKLRTCGMLDTLSDELKETAYLRLRYTDLSLEELGKKLNPPLGKSGVNHRMRKLIKKAEEI